MQDDPQLQRKARRVVFVLYCVTAGLVLLPLVLWWLFGH